jgi:hypothetical protein
VAVNRLRHGWGQGLVLLLGGRFEQRRALLEYAAHRHGATVVALGELARTVALAEQPRADANDHDATELAQARSWLQKANSRGLVVEFASDAEAVSRASERLSAARCSLVLGAALASPRDHSLLEASVRGAGFVAAVHHRQLPMDDVLTQTGKSRSVFVSTAGDAFEALLCEQKLPGVEALRRAP